MDEQIIACPRCETENPIESDICYICGGALHAPPPKRSSKLGIVLLLLVISGGALYFYYHINSATRQNLEPEIIAPLASNLQKARIDSPVEPIATQEAAPIQQPKPPKIVLAVGLAIIKDITGKPLIQIPVPVCAGGWIALPRKLCWGGYEWLLRLDSGEELNIVAGIIGTHDQIGLWRIEESQTIEGPQLQPWAADKPLEWIAPESELPPQSIKITLLNEQDHFAQGKLEGSIEQPGVLLQDDKCVGWTFGSIMEGGYLWIGDEGSGLQAEIRVDDFYRTTFANSREEEFTLALAMGDDYTDLERLAAFANGFRFNPKLSVNHTPPHLQPESVISTMRDLIEQAIQEGYAFEAASAFDGQILINAGDIQLLNDVVRVTVEGQSFEDAIELVEDIAGHIKLKNSKDILQLAELRSNLFQNWITSLLEKGDLQGGLRAFELGSQSLPDDLKIHLLGVRLALAGNDWATAERLLAMKEYPSSLGDQVQNLQNQISELKGRAGKIVIQFTPGSPQVPVIATLNKTVKQQFIVDTGTSLVTIPRSTAELLDLGVDEFKPVHKVYTAGGPIEAPEVILPSIEIDGWEVNNLKALVVDLPNQQEMGLLGLNFLEKFRMDLNTETGILLLEPR